MTIEMIQLRLFIEVVTAGSISAAARRANIVQSALSRRMQLLEFAVGVPLFTRHPGGMALTEAGKTLQAHAELILANYAAMEEDFDLLRDMPSSEVKLGFAKSLSPLIHGVIVSDMARALADVRIQMMEATGTVLQRWLLSREIDLAVMTTWRVDPAFEYYPLWREHLFLALPPTAEGELGDVLRSLRHLPFIGVPGSADLTKVATGALARYGVDVHPRFETDSITSLQNLVEKGDGLTILPYFAIPQEMFQGRLRLIPIERTLPRYLVRRASTPLQGQARKFMALLPQVLLQQVSGLHWIEPRDMNQAVSWSKTIQDYTD